MARKMQVAGSQDGESKPLSQRAYARHRGETHRAVQKAIEDGRLALSLTKDSRGHTKIISAEVADREWAANTRPQPRDPLEVDWQDVDEDGIEGQGHIAMAEAVRLHEVEKWRRAKLKRQSEELDLGVRRGELIPVDEARQTVIEEYTVLKTKLLGIPTRARQRIQHLTAEDVRTIDELVREALESLSDGE